MVRGVGSETAPLLAMVKKEKNGPARRCATQAVLQLRDVGPEDGPLSKPRPHRPLARGFIGLPSGLDDEFYRQLTSESRRAKQNKLGFTVYEWVKEPTVPNEGLDTHLQAEAAAIHFGVRGMPEAIWDRLEAERDTPPAETQLDFEDGLFAVRPQSDSPPASGAPANATGPAPARKPKLSLAEISKQLNG